MNYPRAFPSVINLFFPSLISKISKPGKNIYLSFDDGPHDDISKWILQELDKYQAKATFFFTGKNMLAYPQIVMEIKKKGHAIGNHTFSHMKGWKVTSKKYLNEIEKTDKLLQKAGIKERLFRPPFGKIPPHKIKEIAKTHQIIMWSYLTGDYDKFLNADKVAEKLIKKTKPGHILVFHENEKSFSNLQILLPRILKGLSSKGYKFEKIS